MANLKRGQQIAPMIRGAFIRAAKALEEDGRPLSDIIREELQTRPLDTLKAIASFVPKEMLIEADITTQLGELTDEALASEISRLIRSTEAFGVLAGTPETTTH